MADALISSVFGVNNVAQLSNIFNVTIIDTNSPPPSGDLSWIPSAGQLKIIPSTNDFVDVDPCPSDTCAYNVHSNGTGNQNVIDAWGSAGYAPDWGTYGAMVLHGGGHGDYLGNEVYVFDLNDITFKRLDNPSAPANSADWETYYACDNAWREISDGQPGSCHPYDNLAIIPAGKGGSSKGSLVRVWSQAVKCTNPAHDTHSTSYSHIFDLDNPSARWQRFAAGYSTAEPSYSGYSVYDPVRNCFWITSTGFSSSLRKLDVGTKAWTLYSVTLPSVAVDTATMHYSPTSDLVLATGADRSDNTVCRLYYMDPKNPSGGFKRATLSQNVTPSASTGFMGAAVCTDNNRLYVISAYDKTVIWEILIPTSNYTATWTVNKIPLAGDSAALTSFSSALAKLKVINKLFNYYPKVKCLIYMPGGRGYKPIAYRPAGV